MLVAILSAADKNRIKQDVEEVGGFFIGNPPNCDGVIKGTRFRCFPNLPIDEYEIAGRWEKLPRINTTFCGLILHTPVHETVVKMFTQHVRHPDEYDKLKHEMLLTYVPDVLKEHVDRRNRRCRIL